MRNKAFLSTLFVMLLVGVFDMTRSVTGPLMQKTFSLTYGELGLLFASVSIGYLVGSSSCGWALRHLQVKVAVIIGCSISAVGLLSTGAAHLYYLALGGFALSGIGSGWMEVGVNALVPIIAAEPSQSRIQETELGPSPGPQAGMFNTLHGLYGVGAFAFPVIATWLIAQLGGWRPLYLVLTLVLAVALVVVFVTRFPHAKQNPGRIDAATEESTATPVTDSKLGFSWALFGLLIAITAYVMAEVGVGAWLPTYLVHARQLSLAQSSYYLSGFYATFTVVRLLGHLWVSRVGHNRSIVWSALFAIILVVIGEASTAYTFAFVVAGIGFAIIFPTITAIASEMFPRHSGQVLGLLFTSAGIGSMFISWLIGGVASWFGLNAAFVIIPVCLALTLGGLWISRYRPAVVHEL